MRRFRLLQNGLVLALFGFGFRLDFAFVYVASPPSIALYPAGGSTPLASWSTTETTHGHLARLAPDAVTAYDDVRIWSCA